MKDYALSASTRALLGAAKREGPGMAARAKMWGSVSASTGIAAAEVGAAAASVVAATSTGKLLAAGALLGSALTLSLALTVVRVSSPGSLFGAARHEASMASGRARSSPQREQVEPSGVVPAAEQTDLERSREEPSPIPLQFSTLGSGYEAPPFTERCAVPPSAPGAKAAPGPRPSQAPAATGTEQGDARLRGSDHVSLEDSLSRESALVHEARGANKRGDPEGALALLEAARRVGTNKLEPEELSLRARVLRALGRDAEALQADELLRTRYPDQALVR
jgi:hypothetical protein